MTIRNHINIVENTLNDNDDPFADARIEQEIRDLAKRINLDVVIGPYGVICLDGEITIRVYNELDLSQINMLARYGNLRVTASSREDEILIYITLSK